MYSGMLCLCGNAMRNAHSKIAFTPSVVKYGREILEIFVNFRQYRAKATGALCTILTYTLYHIHMAQKHYRSRERSGSHRRDERPRDYHSSQRKRRRNDDYERERDHYHDYPDYRGESSHHDSHNHISQNRYHYEKDDSYSHKRSRRYSNVCFTHLCDKHHTA
jgi:hypothetical protein